VISTAGPVRQLRGREQDGRRRRLPLRRGGELAVAGAGEGSAEGRTDAPPSSSALGALAAVIRNRDLRFMELSLVGSVVGEFSYGIAATVYIFERVGLEAAGIFQLGRLLCAAAISPLTSSLADRYPRQRVMVATDLARAGLCAAVLLLALTDVPIAVMAPVAFAITMVATAFRPAQQALIPSLARSPAELTAANTAADVVESVAIVVGPGLAGLALAVGDPRRAFAVPVAAYLLSAFAASRIRPAPSARPAPAADTEEAEDEHAGVLAGFRIVIASRPTLALVVLVGAQVLLCGVFDVMVVAAATTMLHTGSSAVGILTAGMGVGGILGAAPMLLLANRLRLSTAFGVGLVGWAVAIAGVGVAPNLPIAVAFVALTGFANPLVDVPAMTLLQRSAPEEVLGRVFGVLETVILVAVGLGAAAAPFVDRLVGPRPTFVLAGIVVLAVTAAGIGSVRRLDAEPTADAAVVSLLGRVELLAPLPRDVLEALARSSEALTLTAGATLFHAGDAGDRYYVVESGRLGIGLPDGTEKTADPGEGVGEIALLHEIPRTATVTALEDSRLRAIDRDPFVSAVTGHSTSRAAAERIIAGRLTNLRPSLGSA
jgi:MFS family permease